jgi:hypothetical protein
LGLLRDAGRELVVRKHGLLRDAHRELVVRKHGLLRDARRGIILKRVISIGQNSHGQRDFMPRWASHDEGCLEEGSSG